MFGYIAKRVLLAIPTLIGISLVTYMIIRAAPGDPAMAGIQGIVNEEARQRAYETMKEYYGLNDHWTVGYGKWIGGVVRGDLGLSMSPDRRPVSTKIKERLWPTMSLALLAIVLSMTLAIPIGLLCAWRQNGWFDTVSSTILYGLYSIPNYVMAIPLILIVSVQLDLLPFQGMKSDNYDELSPTGKAADLAKHYVLILFCFSFGTWAYYARFVRQNMLEVLRQDYIRTARAKGQKEVTIVTRHAFRNTLIPMLTLLGLILPEIISGSVILEVIFNWPGLGRLLFDGIMQRDYTTVMGLSFITACLVLLGMLLADIGYAFVDPRVSYE